MLHLLQSEIFRLRKRSQTWLLLGIAFFLTALLYAGFVIGALVTSGEQQTDLRETLTFSNLTDFGLAFGLNFFGSVMVIIIAAGMMGNEYSWNTLRPLTARARSRFNLLTAKAITAVFYTISFMLVLTVLTAALALVSSAIAGVDAGVSGSTLADAFVFSGKVIVANVPYVAFAFMLATIARSNAAGIAGALGLNFIEQPLFGLLQLASDFFEKVEEFGVSYSSSAFLSSESDGSPVRALVILLVYALLFFGIAQYVFLRRDVTSG